MPLLLLFFAAPSGQGVRRKPGGQDHPQEHHANGPSSLHIPVCSRQTVWLIGHLRTAHSDAQACSLASCPSIRQRSLPSNPPCHPPFIHPSIQPNPLASLGSPLPLMALLHPSLPLPSLHPLLDEILPSATPLHTWNTRGSSGTHPPEQPSPIAGAGGGASWLGVGSLAPCTVPSSSTQTGPIHRQQPRPFA